MKPEYKEKPSSQRSGQGCKWYARNMSYPIDVNVVDLLDPNERERSGEPDFKDLQIQ